MRLFSFRPDLARSYLSFQGMDVSVDQEILRLLEFQQGKVQTKTRDCL